MATNSIFYDLFFQDKEQALAFVVALEKAERKSAKFDKIPMAAKSLSKDQLKMIFLGK